MKIWNKLWMSGSQSELPVPNNYLITVFLRQKLFLKIAWNAQKTKNIFFIFNGCGAACLDG